MDDGCVKVDAVDDGRWMCKSGRDDISNSVIDKSDESHSSEGVSRNKSIIKK